MSRPGSESAPLLFEIAKEAASEQKTERRGSAAGLFLGTSAFTAEGWQNTFYPLGTKPGERLEYYSKQFQTVEVDSTFYGIPLPATVRGWREKTPPDFIFAAKVPQLCGVSIYVT